MLEASENPDTVTNNTEFRAYELYDEMIIGHGGGTCPIEAFDAVRDAVPDIGAYTHGDLVATVTHVASTDTILDVRVNDPPQSDDFDR